ncbi:MAG: hypothetical protein ACRCSG_04090 [Cellulosilyticaceae bacterium]
MFFEKIYWDIRYGFRNWHLTTKYKNKKPLIYWDKPLKEFVNPLLLNESSDNLTYLCSELARRSPYYSYLIKGNHQHSHMVESVFRDAYNHAEYFELADEDQFSKQELEIINRLIRQGCFDRRIL